jgi:cellulose synthase/poly-beta-1,6-N-acetylglucosamine synthase-like glycosyltransferase
LLVVIVLLECQNLLAVWRGWVLDVDDECSDDYTVVVPVYGDRRYFENGEALAPIREHVILALEVTPPAMAAFADEIEQAGWRVHRVRLERDVGPDTMVKAVLDDGAVETSWVIRIDADSYAVDDFGKAIAAAERAQADFCSVKCLVSKPRSLCERLQAVEYQMAMRTRHFRPWMTSGACIIATTRAYKAALDLHSLNFGTCGGDIETGRAAHHLRMRIRHIDFVVYTKAPDTWPSLYRQRVIWWAAGFRSTIVNLDKALRLPLFLAYFGICVWLTFAWKWDLARSAQSLALLPVLIVCYTAICLITNWPVRSRWMILFPYYSLLQVLLMPIPGALWCLKYMLTNRTTGRYKFGLRRGHYPAQAPPLPAPLSQAAVTVQSDRHTMHASPSAKLGVAP